MSQVNVIEMSFLTLAFMFTGACGARFYKQLGLWGILPTIGLGLVLAVLVVADFVCTIRESIEAWRQKSDPSQKP
jgi:hypothetical protein